MTATMALAIEQRRWQAVALYLALGVSRAATRLPPDTIDALLALLERPLGTQRRGH